MLLATAMTGIDWLIVAGYFALIIGIGVLSMRGTTGEQGFFLGGRRMPAWAVAMSFAATALSAATFIGGPQQAYTSDLRLLSYEIGKVGGALLVALLFLPAIYKAGTVTVYGYLGQRIGPAAATASSAMFLLGRLLASGARLFIAGTAFSLILYDNLQPANLVLAIVIFGSVGTLYTALGGIRAVIWTDTLQLVVVIGALLGAMALLLHAIPLPVGDIVGVLNDADKTRVIDTSTDASDGLTLWAAIAMTVFYAAAFGADQDMAQRLLTCKSLKQSVLSLLGATLIALPITVLFMATGLLLYVFYDRPELMGAAAPAQGVTDSRGVYPQFLLHELPMGLRGLAMAGLFAAAMSSLDSVINAMASSVVADLIDPLRRRLGRAVDPGDVSSSRASRGVVVAMGVLLTVAAVVMVLLYDPDEDTLIPFALGVMAFAYAGLMGVFLAVLLSGRGSSASVIGALVVGPAVIAVSRYAQPVAGWGLAWPYWMVIGTAASAGVCLLGRGPGRAGV